MNIVRRGVTTASFSNMIESIASVLRIIEMDINRAQWTYISLTKAFLWFSPSLFFYIVDLWSAVVESDIKTICEFLFVIFGIIINIFPKIITFLLFVDKLKILRDMVVHNTTDSYSNTAGERLLLQGYTTTARIATNVLQMSMIVAASGVYVLPYLANFIRPTWYIPLTFQIFGLSKTSHPGYDAHYLTLYGMVAYTLLWIASDVLFFYFTMYIAFRYDLIQHLVGQLGDFKSEYDTPAKQSVLLRQIVMLLSDTMRFCRKCSETYSLIVFFQATNFMLTAVICLTMFNVNPLISIMGILVIGTQFLIYCAFGEMVNTKRIQTSDAIYCSYWYNIRNIPDLKMISFLLKNSQIDVSLTAFGLFRLSLETYVKVIRAAYSYFTFLKSVI